MIAADDPGLGNCRERLIEAATAAFLDEGYRASVDRIAANAGVAKQTLYNHFPGKADLFREVVEQATAAILVALVDDGRPLRDRLFGFAIALRQRVLSAEGIAFYRAVAAEAQRFPDLAAAFYASGPAQSAKRLATVFSAAMDSGALRREDPDFVARLFLAMLVDGERTHRLFSPQPLPAPQAADAERILDAFLRAYQLPVSPRSAP